MFKLKTLRKSKHPEAEVIWNSSLRSHSSCLECIEVRSSDDQASEASVHSNSLSNADVQDWLKYEGKFSLSPEQHGASPRVPLRILLCQRRAWPKVDFPLSEETFEAVRTSFRLGHQVLAAFVRDNGQFHFTTRQTSEGGKRLQSIDITIKLPQMHQLGNCGLALTHVFHQGTTRAMMHGWNLNSTINSGTKTNSAKPHVDWFTESIRASPSWSHPLLLPVILLDEHISKGEELRYVICEEVQNISGTLGITTSGRLANMEISNFEKIRKLMIDPERRITLSAKISTTITDAINCSDVLRWNKRCRERLLECFREIEPSLSEDAKDGHQELLDYFIFINAQATELLEYIQSLKMKLELQLSVLNNLTAQVDNNLSVEIARASWLESTAMKTLAIVTTVFLPPTFVASLFSMSMFDWKSTGSTNDDSSQVVASTFWIYWAISVPLTLVFLVGFGLWWRRQKYRYDLEHGMGIVDFRPGRKNGTESSSEDLSIQAR